MPNKSQCDSFTGMEGRLSLFDVKITPNRRNIFVRTAIDLKSHDLCDGFVLYLACVGLYVSDGTYVKSFLFNQSRVRFFTLR